MAEESLARLVSRLDAHEQIRQLASRYAHALDQRDMDAMAALFVDDVRTGDGRQGRAALADWLDAMMRPFTVTFHLIGNHVIELEGPDRASGVVYCRPEHQVDGEWIVMPMQYWDRYERRGGVWFFKSRSPHVFYAAHAQDNPAEVDGRFHFPGNPLIHEADLPERFPSWQRFWGVGES